MVSGQVDILARVAIGREADAAVLGVDLRNQSVERVAVEGGVARSLALFDGNGALLVSLAVVEGLQLGVVELKTGVLAEQGLDLAAR